MLRGLESKNVVSTVFWKYPYTFYIFLFDFPVFWYSVFGMLRYLKRVGWFAFIQDGSLVENPKLLEMSSMESTIWKISHGVRTSVRNESEFSSQSSKGGHFFHESNADASATTKHFTVDFWLWIDDSGDWKSGGVVFTHHEIAFQPALSPCAWVCHTVQPRMKIKPKPGDAAIVANQNPGEDQTSPLSHPGQPGQSPRHFPACCDYFFLI